MRMIPVLLCAAILSGCGDDGGGNPAAPSSNVSSIAIVLSPALKIGQTEQATATATLTGGGTQSISSGFRSDTPAVAAVNDAGMVTAAATGLANVFVVSGGQQGTKSLKIVPDYDGNWFGTYVVSSCSDSGAFRDSIKFCADGFSPGSQLPLAASFSQAMDALTANIMLGAVATNPVTSTIGSDGSVSLATAVIVADNPLRIDVTLRLSSPAPGSIVGTLSQTWTYPGVTGSGQYQANISPLTRAGARSTQFSRRETAVRPRSIQEALLAVRQPG